MIWRCNGKFNGKAKCETATLDAEVIQQAFLKAFNQLMGSREKHLKACEAMREVVADWTELNAEIEALNEELQVVAELVSQCIKENASKEQSQEKQPLVLETWDEGLWLTLLGKATVHKDNRITFRFKNGTDIEVGVE